MTSPQEREDERLEYQKGEYHDEKPTRYKSLGAQWAHYMTCKVCGYEYWDCMCEEPKKRVIQKDV